MAKSKTLVTMSEQSSLVTVSEQPSLVTVSEQSSLVSVSEQSSLLLQLHVSGQRPWVEKDSQYRDERACSSLPVCDCPVDMVLTLLLHWRFSHGGLAAVRNDDTARSALGRSGVVSR